MRECRLKIRILEGGLVLKATKKGFATICRTPLIRMVGMRVFEPQDVGLVVVGKLGIVCPISQGCQGKGAAGCRSLSAGMISRVRPG